LSGRKAAACFLRYGPWVFRLGGLTLPELRLYVIVAAIVLTWLPEHLRVFADYRMIIYALMIIALMILRPQGLFSFQFKKKGAGVKP
jgi:ABC-type branched-subunit amino acid transport system permease subunit